jgi:hypothetical protein
MLPPERNAYAYRAADALLTGVEPRGATAAAELLIDAGEIDRGVAVMLDLARRDLRGGALRSAETLLDRAAALLDPADATSRTKVALATSRVELLTLTGWIRRSRSAASRLVGRPVTIMPSCACCWRGQRSPPGAGSTPRGTLRVADPTMSAA